MGDGFRKWLNPSYVLREEAGYGFAYNPPYAR
jgi:hypothetical protein